MLKFEALGTHWFIEIYDNPNPETENAILDTVKDFEAKYSRFLPDSQISDLNRDQFFENPSIEFQKLITLGLEYFKNTEGIFNFAGGGFLKANGYGLQERSVTKIPKQVDAKVILNDTSILIIDPAISIDLGGFGKGFLIDKIAKQLQTLGHKYFLINGGGDIFATTQFGQPITVYLQNPQNTDLVLAELQLSNSALCASSTFKRVWKDDNGITQAHIFNPQTNITQKEVASFVTANNCCLADMLATTTCINSTEDYLAKLHKQYTFTKLAVL